MDGNASSCSAWPPYGRQTGYWLYHSRARVWDYSPPAWTVCGTGSWRQFGPGRLCAPAPTCNASVGTSTYTVAWPHFTASQGLAVMHTRFCPMWSRAATAPTSLQRDRVLGRADKYYTLDIKGKRDTVSLDRLKVAYLDVEHSTDFSPPSRTAHHSNPDHPPTIPLLPPGAGPTRLAQQAPQQTTRSGRRVHWPAHYAQFDCGWTLFFFNISFPSLQLFSGGGSCGDYLTFMYICVNIYITWCERPINASFTRSLVRCTVLYIRCFLHWLFRWFLTHMFWILPGFWIVSFRALSSDISTAFRPFWGVHKSTVNCHYISSFVRSSSVLCEQSTTH